MNFPGALPSVPATTRSRACTLHVDLGEDLKQAVLAAAAGAGVKPSDWVRSQLSAAVGGDAAAATIEAQPRGPQSLQRHLSTPTSADGPQADTYRTHQLSLQPDDIDQLDRVVQAGGFRSRPAALRYVLRVQADPQALSALRHLGSAIPALVDSNTVLQSAIRLEAALGAAFAETGRHQFRGGAAHHPAVRAADTTADPLRRDLQEHLQTVARVIAALQPLLARRA
jgi:hypothetical protein